MPRGRPASYACAPPGLQAGGNATGLHAHRPARRQVGVRPTLMKPVLLTPSGLKARIRAGVKKNVHVVESLRALSSMRKSPARLGSLPA